MRNKSENEQRDRYARTFGAVLVAESLASFLTRRPAGKVTIEAEDSPVWDDVVLSEETGTTRHQVKRQKTDLAKSQFEELMKGIEPGSGATYVFVTPVLVGVDGMGDLRVLEGLCRRLQQQGALEERVMKGLRREEREWVDSIKPLAGGTDESVLRLLRCFRLEVVGFEEALEARGKRALAPFWGANLDAAWTALWTRVAEADGVVELTPEDVVSGMPARAADPERELYLSFVEEVERTLMLPCWEGLTDDLVRALMPLKFYDGVLELQLSTGTTAWPQSNTKFEAALKNLVQLAVEYVTHFRSRAEVDGIFLREDVSFKRVFPNPNYHEEAAAARKWDKGCIDRLWNLVVALNEYVAIVRSDIDQSYRLRHGVFAIHDSFGVRHPEMRPSYWVPDDYRDW